jgi:sucrose-phosphate synthase
MHIVFLNPQGNFDPKDSYLAEHPDFGGQLVYVKEVAIAMAKLGHRVDIVTRRIDDPDWPEFKEAQDYYAHSPDNPRIVRIDCGGPGFLPKEKLWPHLQEFVDNLLVFYGDDKPDFATSHYADGGYCAALMFLKGGSGFTFTGHSLGAQKLDKLGASPDNIDAMDDRYHFSTRIAAERYAMQFASKIITSTNQERNEQYAHPLYEGAVDVKDDAKFSVIPPGVNLIIFNREQQEPDANYHDKFLELVGGKEQPWILLSSRLDEKKNIIGAVRAYADDDALQKKSGLAIFIRGVDDPFASISALSENEQQVLQPILDIIEESGVRNNTVFLNIQSQLELASAYRWFATRGSVFALTAFYEPFGLAPIEAAACGLACVATQNGGPSEIFEDGSGVLVDPFDAGDIARGLNEALDNASTLATQGYKRVIEKYTWNKTAEGYLKAIESGRRRPTKEVSTEMVLDERQRIDRYLQNSQ